MLNMPDTRGKYFSVKHSTKIQGVNHIPSVCYPLPSSLQATIEAMAAKGLARIYTEKVRFVTGVPYPVKKPETPATQTSFVSAPEVKFDTTEKPAVPERPGRRSGRGAVAPQGRREFE
jgi:hypothetical protein